MAGLLSSSTPTPYAQAAASGAVGSGLGGSIGVSAGSGSSGVVGGGNSSNGSGVSVGLLGSSSGVGVGVSGGILGLCSGQTAIQGPPQMALSPVSGLAPGSAVGVIGGNGNGSGAGGGGGVGAGGGSGALTRPPSGQKQNGTTSEYRAWVPNRLLWRAKSSQNFIPTNHYTS